MPSCLQADAQAAAEAGSSAAVLRQVLLHACTANLVELGAAAAPGDSAAWQALHLRLRISRQTHEAYTQLQDVVLRELPQAMLHVNSLARSHAAECACPCPCCCSAAVQLMYGFGT